MKNYIHSFMSEMGYPVSSFEHNLLEKFAKFVAEFEAKVDEPAPVVEDVAPVVAAAPAPVAVEEPAVVEAVTSNTEK